MAAAGEVHWCGKRLHFALLLFNEGQATKLFTMDQFLSLLIIACVLYEGWKFTKNQTEP